MTTVPAYDLYIVFSTPASQERLNKIKPMFKGDIPDFNVPGELEYNISVTAEQLTDPLIQQTLDSIHFANDTTVAVVAIEVTNRYGNLAMIRSVQSDVAKAVGLARRTVHDIKDNLDQFSEDLDLIMEFAE